MDLNATCPKCEVDLPHLNKVREWDPIPVFFCPRCGVPLHAEWDEFEIDNGTDTQIYMIVKEV